MSGLIATINVNNLFTHNQACFEKSITVGTDAYIGRMVRIGTVSTVGSGLQLYGSAVSNGTWTTSDVTQSVNVNSGSIVTAGGVGVAKNLNIGENLGVNGDFNCEGILNVTNVTNSTSTSTGAIVVAGGVGVGGNTYIGGILNVTNVTDATSTSTGAIVVAGGVGVGGNTYIGGILNVTNVTNATSTSTGAIVVAGGVGVGGNTYIGGLLNVTNVTDSTSTSTGAIVVAGGVGVAKNLNVGGNFTLLGNQIISNSGGESLVLAPLAPGVGAHIETSQNTSPTAPGFAGDIASVSISGTDTSGYILMSTVAGNIASVLTVVFSQVYSGAPVVVLTPWIGLPGGIPPANVYLDNATTAGFTVRFTTPLGAATKFGLAYHVIG
jgi:hypothetical protein